MTVFFASVGIALCAASAATINHLADQHVDAVMARTSGRPIVRGKIDSQGALIFALTLGSVGMLILINWVNALTAWLTLASLIGYAFVYTKLWFDVYKKGSNSGRKGHLLKRIALSLKKAIS